MSNTDAGVTLYQPTATYPKFRLTYSDPFSGARRQPGYRSLELGTEAFNDAVAYVTGARREGSTRRSTVPTVDDLFGSLVAKWIAKGNEQSYIDSRSGAYAYRIAPTMGP